MAASVIGLAEPFFLKVLGLLAQAAPDEQQLHKLQRQLMADVQAIEQKVNSGVAGLSGNEWQTVKRVLVYWADEVLTAHIRDWDDYTLEQEYFKEQNRAWKFYVEGEQAIPTSGSEVAELYYLAVVLGFVGDIEDAFKQELRVEMPGGHQDPAEARRYWATQLQRRIRHEAAEGIQGEPLEGDVEPLSSNAFGKAGLAAFLITLLLFLILLAWNALNKQ
ncbi:MAG: DotU family type IV/VI secretion system protein [Fuerstiella sp.]|jgi:type VI protein secretion system component VasF|nr:DotU family type IV/VI secretion system protein [Fuerstiella sp.]MDG2126357.1 DotU family type IV/VI secretion system protein [Fuerstiella sp.]